MGSHKHKRKKKTHKLKQRKREISVSSTEGEQVANWNIPSSDSESEDNSDKRLTTLVRDSYMNHLLQALAKNFQASDHTIHSTSLVKQWSSALERKILKSCMRSRIYRTNMAVMINQVKTSTSNGKVFIEEQKLSKIKYKLPMNKETQTDNVNQHKKVIDFGTQTDPQVTSLLALPLPKDLSPSSKPYDPAIEFSDSLSSTGINSLNLKEALVTTSTNQDTCNITSTSDLINNDRTLCENNLRNANPDQVDQINCFSVNHFDKSVDRGQVNKKKIEDDINKEISMLLEKQPSRANLKPSYNLSKTSISSSTEAKYNLDSRLTSMGLLSEFDNEDENIFSQDHTTKNKRNNWYAEEIAQSCNLTRILLQMSTTQRQRVLRRYKELFGDSDDPVTELSEKNIQICRKRIASVVVRELTPRYRAKKIMSRHLFKYVAKKITRSLMDKSYAPDTRSIRQNVDDYFRRRKTIITESDCE